MTIFGAAFATSCQKCGSKARSFDGVFAFSNVDMRIDEASDEVRQKIEALRLSLKIARETRNIEEALAPLREVSPQIAQLATTASSNGGIAALIAFLAYLLLTAVSNTNIEFNLNQGIDQAHVYVTGSKPYPDLGKGPTSTDAASKPDPETRSAGPDKPKSRQQRRAEERQTRKKARKETR